MYSRKNEAAARENAGMRRLDKPVSGGLPGYRCGLNRMQNEGDAKYLQLWRLAAKLSGSRGNFRKFRSAAPDRNTPVFQTEQGGTIDQPQLISGGGAASPHISDAERHERQR